MKWLVGVDLARSSAGAIRFAQWARDTNGDEVMGTHAMQVPGAATPEWIDAIAQKVRGMVTDFLGSLGVPEGLHVDVAQGNDAERVLADSGKGHDAIVIGRRARTDQTALIRLGAVARRMVRHAYAPLVVCPPELNMDAHTGPIVLATDGTERTGKAAERFAERLSQQWGRPWVAVHVANHVDAYASAYFLNSNSLQQAQVALYESGRRVLDAWAEQLSIGAPSELVLLQGVLDAQLAAFAHDRHAGMLVLGSRQLKGLPRLFSSSAAMALASHADCPVAIVPPDEA